MLILNNPVNPLKLSALPQCNLRCVRYVRIVIFNQFANNPGNTLAADLPQRIKGRNANVVELLFLNNTLQRFNALLGPQMTQSPRAEVAHPYVIIRKSFNQRLHDLRCKHVTQRTCRSSANVRCFFFHCMDEDVEGAFVVDIWQVLEGRAPDSLD